MKKKKLKAKLSKTKKKLVKSNAAVKELKSQIAASKKPTTKPRASAVSSNKAS